MKQLVILSGKGGTGKTSLAAAFAHLASAGPGRLRAVLADADVDAANLELVLRPTLREAHAFTGGQTADIDARLCERCGACADVCRFEAVLPPDEGGGQPAFRIDPLACDGCAACVYVCPRQAIQMRPQEAGRWFRSDTRFGPLFHAALLPARENSGKLVTLVKQQARLLAMDEGYQVVLVDGPPGIGCPVISAASGADLAVVVTEPTAAGIHDMERALDMAAHFRVPALVCVNKSDIYPDGAERIEADCAARGIGLAGRIPFDPAVTQAMVRGEPVTKFQPAAAASIAMTAVWQRVAARLAPAEAET
jgi:MinD superfamily P-loop ATPase